MRLRRVTQNVKDQNWFAVFLDFLIVVSGVYIGIQLGNWNETRQVRGSFEQAQQRFLAENQANLKATDGFLERLDSGLDLARSAIEVLKHCSEDEGAAKTVENSMNVIRGTATLKLRYTALTAITGNDEFLSLMDPSEREAIKEFQRQLNQTQTTLDWLEQRPFENNIEDSPYIAYGDLTPLPGNDKVQIRPLYLSSPTDTEPALMQACRDPEFIKPFYLWERTATFQYLRAGQIRKQFSDNIEGLEDAE